MSCALINNGIGGLDARVVERPDFLDLSGNCTRTRHGSSSTTLAAASTRSAEGASSMPSKDDVVFVSSKDNEATALWVNYLTACFEQISRQQGRPPFKVSQISVEDQLTPYLDQKLRNARLQIVVVCPVFLDKVTERPEQAGLLTRQLTTSRVLAMMLGVQDAQLNAVQKASLHAYQHWRKFYVKDQDETFVGQLLGAAVAILGNAAGNGQAKADKESFSVHPKKVKMGQNRIVALLNEPLKPEDSVTVVVDRCGEGIEVGHVKRRNPYALQFSIPDKCLEVSMIVGVRLAKNGVGLGVRQVKCESRLRELDQILRAHDNPLEFMCQTFGFGTSDREQLDSWIVHAFQKNVPPHFNLLSRPPADVQLPRSISMSEENPTLLHFAARFGLEKLAWQLLECPGADVACDMRNVNDLTPADLAEQAGHIKLAHQLRGYMQMNEFTSMYSYLKVMSEKSNGMKTPSTAQLLEGPPSEDYCLPRPIHEAYSVPPSAIRPVANPHKYLDYSIPPASPSRFNYNGCQPSTPNGYTQNGHCQLDQASQDDAVSETRSTASTIGLDTMTIPSSSSSSLTHNNGSALGHLEMPLQGYMQMSPAGQRKLESLSTFSAPSQHQIHHAHHIVGQSSQESISSDISKKNSDSASLDSAKSSASLGRSSSTKSRGPKAQNGSSSGPQDELLEIINDFKNNVFTIGEVERLVENWKNRNDVQQSFKDKQRQLSAMRDEYERIQRRIKDELKAPSPFDRIKKFFKGKKDSKDSLNSQEDLTSINYNQQNNNASNNSNNIGSNNKKVNGVNAMTSDRRPISSLSLHSVSSSSSGRMSTASGCSGTSLGDSGTHSDTDDRRLHHHNHHSHHNHHNQQHANEDKPGMTNYEIPPAPKPFNQGSTVFASPTPTRFPQNLVLVGGNSEFDLRSVKSTHSTTDDKEYYIEFPPSGLPVHCFEPDGTLKEPKTPLTPVGHHDFADFAALANEQHQQHQQLIKELKIDEEQLKMQNYTNLVVNEVLPPPPPTPPDAVCLPPDYINVDRWPAANLVMVRPEIHAEPARKMTSLEEVDSAVEEGESEVKAANIFEDDAGGAEEMEKNEINVVEKVEEREETEERGEPNVIVDETKPEPVQEEMIQNQVEEEIQEQVQEEVEGKSEEKNEGKPEEKIEEKIEEKKEKLAPVLAEFATVQINNSTSVDEIARNFGVTLKKLPGPPVPPRTEFNFVASNVNPKDSSQL